MEITQSWEDNGFASWFETCSGFRHCQVKICRGWNPKLWLTSVAYRGHGTSKVNGAKDKIQRTRSCHVELKIWTTCQLNSRWKLSVQSKRCGQGMDTRPRLPFLGSFRKEPRLSAQSMPCCQPGFPEPHTSVVPTSQLQMAELCYRLSCLVYYWCSGSSKITLLLASGQLKSRCLSLYSIPHLNAWQKTDAQEMFMKSIRLSAHLLRLLNF